MANEVKYDALNWPTGSPIAGERLATNSHYTGEHLGTVMQDAKGSAVAHATEAATVRYGTIMQDAADTNFPKVSEG